MTAFDRMFVVQVLEEVERARAKFPGRQHQLAALTEEVGELAKALLDHSYGKGSPEAVLREAVQVAAMALRVASEGDQEFPYEPDAVFRCSLDGARRLETGVCGLVGTSGCKSPLHDLQHEREILNDLRFPCAEVAGD